MKKEFILTSGKKLEVELPSFKGRIKIFLDGVLFKELTPEEERSLMPGRRALFGKSKDNNDVELNINGSMVGIRIKLGGLSFGSGPIVNVYENGALLDGSDSTPKNLEGNALGTMKFLVGWAIFSLIVNFFLGTVEGLIIAFILIWVYLTLYFQIKKLKKWALITSVVVFSVESLIWLFGLIISGGWSAAYVLFVMVRISILTSLVRAFKIFKKPIGGVVYETTPSSSPTPMIQYNNQVVTIPTSSESPQQNDVNQIHTQESSAQTPSPEAPTQDDLNK